MEDIQKIILKDKEIIDPQIMQFIKQSMIETGGIKYVSQDLKKNGYEKFVVNAYPLLDEAKKTNILNLKEYSLIDMRLICTSIVASLEDCKDLNTLMMLTMQQAMDLIRRI